jgi:hypothetical protein
MARYAGGFAITELHHQEGRDRGFDLNVEVRETAHVADCFAPQRFPGDVETDCVLHDGLCRALKVFFDRNKLSAEAVVMEFEAPPVFILSQTRLAFALRGSFTLDHAPPLVITQPSADYPKPLTTCRDPTSKAVQVQIFHQNRCVFKPVFEPLHHHSTPKHPA